MDAHVNRSHPRLGSGLCLGLVMALIPACQSDPGSPAPDGAAEVANYAGTWTQNGTSGTQKATMSLVIGADLSYRKTTSEFETTAKVALASSRAVSATVTDITPSENNADYETIFIDLNEVQLTPESAGEADEWNTMAYGGVTTWIQGVTLTFDAENPGPWEHGTIWLSHVAVSVLREGDLLNVNERGGFDGQDPPEDVYFLSN